MTVIWAVNKTNIVLLLAHRFRHWPNIKLILVQRLVFAGSRHRVNTVVQWSGEHLRRCLNINMHWFKNSCMLVHCLQNVPRATLCWANVVFMLGRRRRRRANIKIALVYSPVFPGSRAINLSGGRETDCNACITMTSNSKRNMLYLYLYANYN